MHARQHTYRRNIPLAPNEQGEPSLPRPAVPLPLILFHQSSYRLPLAITRRIGRLFCTGCLHNQAPPSSNALSRPADHIRIVRPDESSLPQTLRLQSESPRRYRRFDKHIPLVRGQTAERAAV
ncbi:hypothetical protein D3C84_777070 [compost metagenome]